MAKFDKGAEAIREAAKSTKRRNFTPILQFGKKDNEKQKYLQYLVPLREVPTVLWHNFAVVGRTKEGKPLYEHFISQRTPALGKGQDGYDPIEDIWGQAPKKKNVALAVELEPIKTGKKITGFKPVMNDARSYKKRDGTEVTVGPQPKVVFVVQSPFNFFNYYTTYEESTGNDINEVAWLVEKQGGGEADPVSYKSIAFETATLLDVGSLIPEGTELPTAPVAENEDEQLTDEQYYFVKMLDDYTDELSDEENQRVKLEPLVKLVLSKGGDPFDTWAITNPKYRQDKDNKITHPIPEGVTASVSDEGDDDTPPWEESEAEVAPKTRRRKFKEMQEQVS